MDRRKTILIAVMINAGILAVLFIAGLTTHEEISSSTVEMAQMPQSVPLFPDSADAALQQPVNPVPIPLVEPVPISAPAPAPIAPPEEPLAHKLPPIAPEPAPASTPPAPAAVAPVQKAETSYLEITVKKGDSLDKIAKEHRTTVDEILKINQLPSSFLRVGQVLKLPAPKVAAVPKSKTAPEKSVATGPEYYTVKVGDNPWTIAMKHHMKVEDLLKLNNLNEERARKLKPGDRLRTR